MLVELIREGIVLMIQVIIYKISGIWLWHRVLRTSWARIFWDRRRGGIDHIGGGVLLYGMSTLDFSLFGLVDVLLVVSNNTLGEGLSDGVDLGDVTSSSDSDSDVEVLEFLESKK